MINDYYPEKFFSTAESSTYFPVEGWKNTVYNIRTEDEVKHVIWEWDSDIMPGTDMIHESIGVSPTFGEKVTSQNL